MHTRHILFPTLAHTANQQQSNRRVHTAVPYLAVELDMMLASQGAKRRRCSTTIMTIALLFIVLAAIGVDAETYVVRGSNGDKIQV